MNINKNDINRISFERVFKNTGHFGMQCTSIMNEDCQEASEYNAQDKIFS